MTELSPRQATPCILDGLLPGWLLSVAWVVMHSWLENFAYRIDLNARIFITGGGLVILIAVFTISFQSIKAAFANPIKTLRNE